MNIIKYILFFILIGLFSHAEAQWKKIETIPAEFTTQTFLDIYFLETNPNFGWACGFGGTVIFTTDAGDTWDGVKLKLLRIDTVIVNGIEKYDTTYLPQNVQLESIHFATEKIGYTSGSDNLYKTTDGGYTWEYISDVRAKIWGTFFINENVGLAVGGGCGIETQQFHRTTNGGKTWATFEVKQGMTGLSDAMLLSENGRGYASSSGRIWITDNGGRTWDILSVTGPEDWQEEITNVNNSFLVPYSLGCDGGGESGSKDGGLRMSTDFGKTWRQFSVGTAMYGTFLIDSIRGWGCGKFGKVYYTSDGGKNWELRDCGIDGNHLDDIWFVTDSIGWVVGDGVYKTHYYDTTRAKIAYNGKLQICAGDSLILSSSKDFEYYRWSTGDTTKSIVVHKSGKYKLEAYNHICEFKISDSVDVSFFPETIIELLSSIKGDLCVGDSISFWLNTIYKDILWSTNQKTDTIKIRQSGTYSVTIIDINGCEWSKFFDVVFNPLPVAEIQVLGKYAFCDGDSTILTTTRKFSSYKWFVEKNPDSIFSESDRVIIKSPGKYAVIVMNEFGCKDTSDYITIEVWDLTNRLKITSYSDDKKLIFDTLGLTKMQCLNLLVQNLSDTDVPLHSIILAYNIEFSIPKNQIPIILSPGESIDLLVCFRPLGMDERRDTIFIGDTCSSHTIPLLGWGKANEYKGESDCGVELKFRTDSLMGAEYFNTSSPFPNPSKGIIIVKYRAKASMEMSFELRNTIGILMQEGKLNRINNANDNENPMIDGETALDFANIPEGMYYLLIRTQSEVQSYPIVIIK